MGSIPLRGRLFRESSDPEKKKTIIISLKLHIDIILDVLSSELAIHGATAIMRVGSKFAISP